MDKIKVCIISGYGINADRELAAAFKLAGGLPERIHINDLVNNPSLLENYGITGFPGGFSFGDHLGSGLVFSHKVKKHLSKALNDFIAKGKLIIGICNGFQILVKMGILPNLTGRWKQEVSIVHNDSGKFMDKWVQMSVSSGNSCKWLEGIETIHAPIRHGEGKFIAPPETIAQLEKNNLAVLRYQSNPNGSMLDIAGITDTSGQILGMMPHPEAFLIPENHPQWQRNNYPDSLGLAVFKNGIKYTENL